MRRNCQAAGRCKVRQSGQKYRLPAGVLFVLGEICFFTSKVQQAVLCLFQVTPVAVDVCPLRLGRHRLFEQKPNRCAPIFRRHPRGSQRDSWRKTAIRCESVSDLRRETAQSVGERNADYFGDGLCLARPPRICAWVWGRKTRQHVYRHPAANVATGGSSC